MKNPWILLNFLLLFSSAGTTARAQITNGAYRAVLKTLYKNTVPLVSCEEAHAAKEALFLDSRAQVEFNVSHIAGARWIGYEDFLLERVQDIDKDQMIIIYCSVGVRSERIGKRLLDAGYTRVRNLHGSIFEWVNQGYPVVNATGRPTQKVHAYSPAWGIWLDKGEKVYK